MIDWTDPTYVAQGYFAAYVQWIDVQCYSSAAIPYLSSNSSSATNSSSVNSTRLAKRFGHGHPTLWERELYKRDDVINSYVYGGTFLLRRTFFAGKFES